MNDLATIRRLLSDAIRLRDSGQDDAALEAFYAILTKFGDTADPQVREKVAEALLDVGILVRLLGNNELAIALFDKLISRYGAAGDTLITALFHKGGSLVSLKRFPLAVETYEEMLRHADSYGGSDPAIPDYVAVALQDFGAIHSNLGSTEKALAAFDEVIRRFANNSNPGLQGSVAQAMYNRAMVLRNAKRGSEAIAAFTKVVDHFADSSRDELCHWAGMAQYNKVIHLMTLRDLQASADGTEEMLRRFGTSNDPEIRVRLAKALYSRAMILKALGLTTESVQASCDIQARFKDEPNSVIQSVVAAARRRERLLVALENPAFDAAISTLDLNPVLRSSNNSNVDAVVNVIWDGENQTLTAPQSLRLDEVHQILLEDEQEPVRIEDLDLEDVAATRKLFRDQLRRDLEGHRRCGEILASYLYNNEPFGLFLRNFDVEGYLKAGSGMPEPIRLSVQLKNEGSIEKMVAAQLSEKLQFIGVGNNAPVRSDFRRPLPRILLSNEHWQEAVEELVGAASIIVMDIVRLTPGVRWELDVIERLSRQDETVIIISEPRPEDSGVEAATLFFGVKGSEDPLADSTSAELRSFRRIVPEAELPDNLVSASLISDLLSQVESIQKTEPSERPRWDGIVF